MAPAELQMSEERLKHLLLQFKYLAAVRRVARGVAHSYNNIFTGLSGQATLLQQEKYLPDDTHANRGDLINGLLQRGIDQTAILYGFSRDGDMAHQRHSPFLLAKKAIELLNSISRLHRFTLHSEINQGKIICNPRDMVLILFYIGENCVDATQEGGEIVLTLGSHQESGSELAFCFRDHGPGISEEQVPAFGTPFISATTDAPQRGLGLYAARILAERFQGRLTYVREAGLTTLASAVFPLAAEEPMADSDIPDVMPRQHDNNPMKQCFLIVEDDEAMRAMLLTRLQRRGHMVFCVDTCAEAVDEYNHLHDIITTILMDVGLHDASGYECRWKILTVNPHARIIFMSGQDEMAPRELAGKGAFLQKPFTIDQLERAVHDVHI